MSLDPKGWKKDISISDHLRIDYDVYGEPHTTYTTEKSALQCVRCDSIRALSPCTNCGGTVYEPGQSTSGSVGLFCKKCEKGFSNWTCMECRTENAVNKTMVKKSGMCFIATAAYGTPLSTEVQILSAFRDNYLLQYDVGRLFVKFYYLLSPPLAEYIGERDWARSAVRILLRPLIAISKRFDFDSQ